MGETTEAHSPDGWAAYIIDRLRTQPVTAVDSYYKDVFGAYMDHVQDRDTDTLDRERIARYLMSEPADAEHREQADVYWGGIRDDFATFLEEDYATDDPRETATQRDDLTVEQLYTPGACAVDGDIPRSVAETTWLTSIITAYREENDDVYVHHVAYLDEEDARTAVQHLLEHEQTDTVERVLWKSVRRGYNEPMQGFAEELAAAGETATLEQVITKAEDRHYTDEVEQMRDAVGDQ